jgi:Domain of unknown function (DUF4407)
MSPKANLNPIGRFLIWSSGADHEILARESCLTERYKYESIGATVVLTAIMAFFSGGYALFTVFGSVPVSIALGAIWSSVIFNLDRFFILTANQRKSDSKRQFYIASALRLSIAVLLSLVVAKPLELRLFEREISQELQQVEVEKQREARQKQQKEWEESSESRRISEINAELRSLAAEERTRTDEVNKATSAVIQEIEGSGGTGKPGRGGVYEEKNELKQKLEQEINNLKNRIKLLTDERETLIKQRNTRLGESIVDLNTSQQRQEENEKSAGSLLERLSALESLAKRDPAVASTNGLVTLLFIIIEISPILVKMLSKEGLYEELLEKENGYRTGRENLRKIKEKEILKLEELKDFELKVEAFIVEYVRLKERNKDKLENAGIYDTRGIQKQHDQETARFLRLCKERLEGYESLANKVLASDVDRSTFQGSDNIQNGAKGQSRNHAEMLE